MTRSELVELVAKQFPHLYVKEVEQVVSCILEEMSQSLENDERIEIRGLGTFQNSHRAARKGRNPKTGESVTVPAKPIPRFKVSKGFVQRLNAESK